VNKGWRSKVPDTDLAVTLTFASGEHAAIEVQVDELASEIGQVTGRLDDLDRRVQEIRRRTGLSTGGATRPPSLRSVASGPDVPSSPSWEEALSRAQEALGDETADLDALLSADEVASIDRRFVEGFTVRSRLDRFDILAAVAAGVTAGLLDYLVVAAPNRSGLTNALRSLSTDSDNWLAGVAKVPYDQVAGVDLSGFNPNAHRVQTFGHDPMLGWVYGTMDILRGSLTGVSRSGVVKTLDMGPPTAHTLPAALAIQAMHLISDIVTPAGLQLPGWSALLTIDKTVLGSDRTVAELSRLMYVRGYDTWHLPTMAVPVLAIEAVLRGYVGLRQVIDEGYREELDLERLQVGSDRVADLPRYEVMALIARSIAVAGNTGRFVLSGSNPLTLNFPLWLAFAKSFLGRLDRATPGSALTVAANTNRLILDAGWVSLQVELDDLPKINV
jgi:hypothetical protein